MNAIRLTRRGGPLLLSAAPSRGLGLAIALCLAAVATSSAQETAGPQPRRLDYQTLLRAEQEPSYSSVPWLMWGLPRQSFKEGDLHVLYEGTVAPPFFIVPGRNPLLLAITPKIVVRQFAGGFFPVPPPSFMPRITAYYWGWPYAPRTTIDSAAYAFLRVSHHSNGQDNDYLTSSGQVNYYDGKFATNYLELGVVQHLISAGPIVGAQLLSFEWHPPGWMRPELHSRYAPYRFHLNSHVEFVRVRPLEGAVLSLGYLAGPTTPDRQSVLSRVVLSYTVYSGVGQLGDFALFASYYTGEDYYNIRFDRNISTFKIGALAGVHRLPHDAGAVQALPAMR
jgi:hypothetical protein